MYKCYSDCPNFAANYAIFTVFRAPETNTYLLNKSLLLVRWRVLPQICLQLIAATCQDGLELLKVCWRFFVIDCLCNTLKRDSKNQAEIRMVKLSFRIISSSSSLQLNRSKQPSTGPSLYFSCYLNYEPDIYCGRLETLPSSERLDLKRLSYPNSLSQVRLIMRRSYKSSLEN